jgi:hypothetical protein
VTELMTTLSDIEIPSGPGPWKPIATRLRTYVDDPADGLIFTGQHLTHTDWMPDNVLISPGRAWLVDWAWAAPAQSWIDLDSGSYASSPTATPSPKPKPLPPGNRPTPPSTPPAVPRRESRAAGTRTPGCTSSRGVSRGRSVNGSLRSMIRPAGESFPADFALG